MIWGFGLPIRARNPDWSYVRLAAWPHWSVGPEQQGVTSSLPSMTMNRHNQLIFRSKFRMVGLVMPAMSGQTG